VVHLREEEVVVVVVVVIEARNSIVFTCRLHALFINCGNSVPITYWLHGTSVAVLCFSNAVQWFAIGTMWSQLVAMWCSVTSLLVTLVTYHWKRVLFFCFLLSYCSVIAQAVECTASSAWLLLTAHKFCTLRNLSSTEYPNLTMGPTCLPVQWVLGLFSKGKMAGASSWPLISI
jgi:hypothetical protein